MTFTSLQIALLDIQFLQAGLLAVRKGQRLAKALLCCPITMFKAVPWHSQALSSGSQAYTTEARPGYEILRIPFVVFFYLHCSLLTNAKNTVRCFTSGAAYLGSG